MIAASRSGVTLRVKADLAARIEGRQVGGDPGVDRGRAAQESSCEQAAVQRAEAENAARPG
jgi:hypothetical protein